MSNQGFFTKKEVTSDSRPDGRTYSCVSCGLVKNSKTPRMKPFGNCKKGIINIGEFPEIIDDKRGKPFQSKAGKLLQEEYEKMGIDLFEDCLNFNAVNCLCTDKDGEMCEPSLYQIACCRRSVMRYLKDHQPLLIVVFGTAAITSLIGHRWMKNLGDINKWRGWVIPDQDLKAWVCPTVTPSSVLNGDREVLTVWRQDLCRALETLDKPFERYKEPEIEIIEDLRILDTIKTGQIAFDYETTGIKPHAKGHRIICASIAYEENRAYSFMIPCTKIEREPFLRLLRDPVIGKIAQNMKFEHTWTLVKFRTEVIGWDWDTMLASHMLDYRKGVTGLKFQTYVQFGIIDYDSEISPYLKAKDTKNKNAINEIEKLLTIPNGKKDLLKYCGLDSIYEYRLAMKQIDIMNYAYLPF